MNNHTSFESKNQVLRSKSSFQTHSLKTENIRAEKCDKDDQYPTESFYVFNSNLHLLSSLDLLNNKALRSL
ncbi:CLUMA_CG007438, isoform A [Clunio marinus]|uniref:CLUMA_CG007438, isoform A n=1 Tax=Clunio marinus TaxID=568069 RepID=A0A1J1I0N6_9DIPT|nr:CLUMA_CG007438, isoform A [Clunio marinus]